MHDRPLTLMDFGNDPEIDLPEPVSFAWQLVVIALMALLVTGIVMFSLYQGKRMMEHYTPLLDATMELKLEVTTAHLWFEEILTSDRDSDLAQVHQHLENARWYAHAMLEGGENQEGRFIPLDDNELRESIHDVEDKLIEFRHIMELRWQERNSVSQASQKAGQAFDRVFSELVTETDQVESRIQETIRNSVQMFNRIQWTLSLLMLVATSLVTWAFWRNHQRVSSDMAMIRQSHSELADEIRKRREMELVLKQQASTDALTGVPNRRYINYQLDKEAHRVNRYGGHLSVVLLDVDHFKRINDHYGHDIGDEVLIEFARIISNELRESDLIARWGGEEFMLLLPQTPLKGAVIMAERCRRKIEFHTFPGCHRVTASFGVAEFSGDEEVRHLVARADAELYEAKKSGRNQVSPYMDLTEAHFR